MQVNPRRRLVIRMPKPATCHPRSSPWILAPGSVQTEPGAELEMYLLFYFIKVVTGLSQLVLPKSKMVPSAFLNSHLSTFPPKSEIFVLDPKQLGFPDWRQFQFDLLSLVKKEDWLRLSSRCSGRHGIHFLSPLLSKEIPHTQGLGQLFKQGAGVQSLVTGYIVYLHL